MTKTDPKQVSHEKGITLIEMLVFLLLLTGILWGIVIGIKIGSEHGPWMTLCGIVLGAIAGGLGVIILLCLVISFFCFVFMVKRMFEPADLVCRCQELGTPVPEHLIADTSIKQEAVAESHKLMEWPEFARIRNAEPLTADILRTRLAEGTLSEERIAFAASLGDSSASALSISPVEPVLQYKSWTKMPEDIQRVLRSGLPPRLCMIWALSCVERVLPTFEMEFHQDTRPRQIFGAALMVLRENKPEALELCNTFLHSWWDLGKAGCRVLHRDLKERMKGNRSLGEQAAHAVYRLPREVSCYVKPNSLWTVSSQDRMWNAYATPQARCDWSGPWYRAGYITYEASLAAKRLEAEYQWQREELIRMILGWERWDEDRLDWQKRMDDEWIPRIQTELKDVKFDITTYVELVRKELVPWRKQGI